jgi:hypothetical protein
MGGILDQIGTIVVGWCILMVFAASRFPRNKPGKDQ